LTPTRELAKQVLSVIHDLLGRDSKIRTAFIIGGEKYSIQMAQLAKKPRIIVGTPGRINDHLKQGSVKLQDTDFLVLDETDRMLDMGFGVQLDKIIKFLPKKRQTLMFSATLPKDIINLSGKYLNNPKRVSVGETNVIAANIKQDVIRIEQGDKYKELLVQLHERQGSVIVFVKTKYSADKMAKKLRQDGFTSEGLHGDLRQNKRDKTMQNFRNKNFRILVATDIAARGLDVPHIEHVINYDLPQVAEDYIHRMGRTARAGAEGSALSFVSPADGRKWHAIECILNPEIKKEGKKPSQRKNKSRHKPYKARYEDKKQSHGEKQNGAKSRKSRPGGFTSNSTKSGKKHFKKFSKKKRAA
jgi:superfamily II DNA/RNA helicase